LLLTDAGMAVKEEPKLATIALLGLRELSREDDAWSLPYGALAAPAKLPRGALADAKLLVMKENPKPTEWSLAGSGFGDEHIRRLMEVLHGSECAIRHLDLSFNKRLTDKGLLAFAEFLGREGMAGHDLEMLRLGANENTTEAARNTVLALLQKQRPDLVVDLEPTLKPAGEASITPLLQVGKVFADSPASAAGLVKGDLVVQIGPCTFSGKERNRGFKSDAERHMDSIELFRGVAETLKPLVQEQAARGGALDVIVQRGTKTQLALLLEPGKWAGEGLLGAKMGLPA